MKKLIYTLLLTTFVVNATAQEFCKFAIKPQFQQTTEFCNGFANVMLNNKWGVIDINGNYICEPTYEYIGPFSCGLAVIKENNKYGFIDTTGKIVIEPKLDNVRDFHDDMAIFGVGDAGGYNMGVIDKTGKIIVPARYRNITDYEYGRACYSPFYSTTPPPASTSNKSGDRVNPWGEIVKKKFSKKTIATVEEVEEFEPVVNEKIDLSTLKIQLNTNQVLILNEGTFSNVSDSHYKWGWINKAGETTKIYDAIPTNVILPTENAQKSTLFKQYSTLVEHNLFKNIYDGKPFYRTDYYFTFGDYFIIREYSQPASFRKFSNLRDSKEILNTTYFNERKMPDEKSLKVGFATNCSLKELYEKGLESYVEFWKTKGEFETTPQWQGRLKTYNQQKNDSLCGLIVYAILNTVSPNTEVSIGDYDADNNALKVHTPYGSFLLNVKVDKVKQFRSSSLFIFENKCRLSFTDDNTFKFKTLALTFDHSRDEQAQTIYKTSVLVSD